MIMKKEAENIEKSDSIKPIIIAEYIKEVSETNQMDTKDCFISYHQDHKKLRFFRGVKMSNGLIGMDCIGEIHIDER